MRPCSIQSRAGQGLRRDKLKDGWSGWLWKGSSGHRVFVSSLTHSMDYGLALYAWHVWINLINSNSGRGPSPTIHRKDNLQHTRFVTTTGVGEEVEMESWEIIIKLVVCSFNMRIQEGQRTAGGWWLCRTFYNSNLSYVFNPIRNSQHNSNTSFVPGSLRKNSLKDLLLMTSNEQEDFSFNLPTTAAELITASYVFCSKEKPRITLLLIEFRIGLINHPLFVSPLSRSAGDICHEIGSDIQLVNQWIEAPGLWLTPLI